MQLPARILLAICAALATVTWAAQDTSAVPTDPTLVKPLRSGTQVPTFTVRRTDGTAYVFEASKRKVPAVVLFYRGGWCPFCNVHLGQLKAAEATLRKRGYEIMFLSSDRADILRTSLKDDIEKETAHYTLLSDADASAARAFGVAFRLDDKTYEQYKSFGIDLEQTAGNKQHILPVPAVFVVDKRGTVRFAHFNPDYRIRLSADELLKAAPANLR